MRLYPHTCNLKSPSPTPPTLYKPCTLPLSPQLYSKSVITHINLNPLHTPKKPGKKSLFFEGSSIIHGSLGQDHHGVAQRPTELGVPRLAGLRAAAAAAAGQGAAAAGSEAAADHRQHDDNGQADPPRPGGAGEAVRRAAAPPPRLASRVRGVDAGVRAGGAARAGRRLLQPAGDHRHLLPHLRPRRHGVRALRALLAPDAQDLRHEALQPPPRRDVARRARRVRCARPRRRGFQRRGRQPWRDHLQHDQERHLPRRLRHPRRRRAGGVHRHPPGVLQALRRVKCRRLHPVAQLDGPAWHQPPPPRGSRRARQVHRQDHRRAHEEGKEPQRRQRRHGRRHARVPGRGQAAGREGRRRRQGCPAEHPPPHPRQHQGHHHGCDVWRDGDGGVGDRVGDGGDDAQPRRPPAAAAGACRRGGAPPERDRGRPRQAPLPQVRRQGNSPPAPAHPAAPPRDRRGLRRRRLLRAQGLARHDQRLGHRPRPQGMEGRRRVPAVAVRAGGGGRGARLEGRLLRVPAVRVRQAVVPRHGAGPVRAGVRRRATRARVQLGAARRHEVVGARHGRHLRPRRAARHPALRRAHASAHLPLVLTT